MNNCSIFVVTHKKYNQFIQDGYETLLVGAEKNNTFDNTYICDNTGDNISELNDSFCELTGLYWIWKNVEQEIIGLVHYRRVFASLNKHFDFIGRHIVFSKEKPYQLLSFKEIESSLQKADIIVKESEFRFRRVKYIFLKQIGIDLFEKIEEIIRRQLPEYEKDFKWVCKSHSHFNCNMFIGKKKVIDQYCEWIFPILFTLDDMHKNETGQRYHNREIGYVSELLLRVWIKHNKINYVMLPVVFTEDSMVVNGVLTPSEFIHFLVNRTIKKLKELHKNES